MIVKGRRRLTFAGLLALGLWQLALMTTGTAEAEARPVGLPALTDGCKTLLDQGEEQYYHSQYQAAIDTFKKALTCYQQAKDQVGEGLALNDIGVSYHRLAQYPEALQYLQQALDLRRKVGPRGGEGMTLDGLASVYQDLGQYEEALKTYQQALPIFREIKYQPGEAQTLNNLGTLSFELGQYEEALIYHRQALALYIDLQNETEIRTSLSNIGAVYEKQWQYAEALKYYQQALERPLATEDLPGKASLLNNLGAIYYDQGQYEEALKYYQQALDISRQIHDPAGESTVLNSLGAVYDLMGQYQTALDHYQQSLEIHTRVGDQSGQANNLHNLGGVYYGLGQYPQALQYYQQAIDLYHALNRPREEANTLESLGLIYRTQGQYQAALQKYRQALELSRNSGSESGSGSALNHIGEIYFYLGQYQAGLQYLLDAQTIQSKINAKPDLSITLNDLGVINDTLAQYPEALQYYQQALEIDRALGRKDREAVVLSNLGAVYKNQRQYQEALNYYQQSLKVRYEGTDRVGQAAGLDNIGVVYAELGQYLEALKYHRQALDMRREMGERDGAATSLQNMGFAYEQLGQLDQALDAYRQSIEVRESIRTQATVEEIKTALAGQALDVYAHTISLLLKLDKPGEAFAVAEHARARTFLDQLGNRNFNIRAGADPKQVAREQDLMNQISALQRKIGAGGAIDYADLKVQLANLQADYQQVLIDLKLSNPAYASLVSVAPLSVQQIRDTILDDQTTLVAYFVTDQETIAYALDRTHLIAISLPISQTRLAAQIDRFRHLIEVEPRGGQSSSAERIELAQELYQSLIAPLLSHIRQPRLIIVPHQSLHYLPFAALLDENQRLLGERFTLSLAPSASSLDPELFHPGKPSSQVLIVGNPAINTDVAAPLPYAEAEAEAVTQLYPQATLFTGTQASEAALRRNLPDVNILHLATHGVLEQAQPLFSSLLLAGASDNSGDDGRLEVREIFELDLSAANLVVLSACDTALGQQSQGDELVGLARAFMFAGTPTVVASLWPIQDEATAALMTAFHKRVQAGTEPAAALAEAQSEIRNQTRWAAPYFWAGFLVIGDGGQATAKRARTLTVGPTAEVAPPSASADVPRSAAQPAKSFSFTIWIVIAGIVVLMGITGFLVWRRRPRNRL